MQNFPQVLYEHIQVRSLENRGTQCCPEENNFQAHTRNFSHSVSNINKTDPEANH